MHCQLWTLGMQSLSVIVIGAFVIRIFEYNQLTPKWNSVGRTILTPTEYCYYSLGSLWSDIGCEWRKRYTQVCPLIQSDYHSSPNFTLLLSILHSFGAEINSH